jgi:hydroxylamine reductase (hybrid-cluster protein)
MSYIYDILLNWTDELVSYDFYEWKAVDDVEHIKKIPIIKIDIKDLGIIYNAEFTVSKNIIDMINGKTELFNNKSGNRINNAVIFTDGLRSIAIEFNNEGKSIFKSKLLLDEEDETLDIARKMDKTTLDYHVIKSNKEQIFMTRYEREVRDYLINEFNKIYQNKNINKLKYLYFEWFNNNSNDFEYMFNKIKRILNMEWSSKHINLYNLIKLSYVKK